MGWVKSQQQGSLARKNSCLEKPEEVFVVGTSLCVVQEALQDKGMWG